MAEEKKGKSSRGGQKVQSKRTTPLKDSKPSRTRQTKSQIKGVRSEIKGLVLMGFAILALIGMAGVDTGIWGSIISGIFSYGFGLGGWVVAIWGLFSSDYEKRVAIYRSIICCISTTGTVESK